MSRYRQVSVRHSRRVQVFFVRREVRGVCDVSPLSLPS